MLWGCEVKTKATKEDWIILRLVILFDQVNPEAICPRDVARAVFFLGTKLGFDRLGEMIDAIRGEMKRESL